MAAEFTRTRDGQDILFTVKPAAPPALLSWLMAPVIFAFVIAIGGAIGDTIGTLIGIAGGAYLAWLFLKHAAKGAKPIELRVTDRGLHVRNVVYAPDLLVPMDDIAELVIWDPRSKAPTPSSGGFVIGGTGGLGLGLAAGSAVASGAGKMAQAGLMAMAARQLQVRLRRRSHSKPATIVHFLTEAEAVALVGDLIRDMSAREAGAAA